MGTINRDYKKEYANYQGRPEQIKNRALRNAARREAMQDGLVRKGDGMDVDHKRALSMGGTNDKNNRRVVTKSENRSFPRTSTGAMKSNT